MNEIYHLNGYNEKTLLFFHHLTDQPIFFYLMKLSSAYIGNYLWAPVTLPILMALSLYALRKQNKNSKSDLCIKMLKSFIIMISSLLIMGILVKLLKSYFEMPRPYCSVDGNSIREFVVHKTAKCFRSFPSGHTAYTAVIVASIWPILGKSLKCGSVIILSMVCVSRLAMAMHYPTDVIASLILSLITVFLVTKLVSNLIAGRKKQLVNICDCLTK
ncbi:MAG: phosphatase PAP2 family protein [Rickettsiales bacterium]